ncbi:uncharacterized protein M421DRAFT_423375 [Didymella exigua CBS 183.55]|uniref:Uncharacterized protein n=1 Tax=Didymella exigua CBS 183.55 TaxID=1150837 RepID=A0A6A5RC38_9PLEO|nr:uncharacterized protein M421DRAFT_423375 [Didymella exigua CBS 183.55]KAF1925815.1 hypothetical protein M421DRAFT_423375 [Didymella exigua CBS 183.55]
MIVTIDDYRGTANPKDGPCHNEKVKDDGSMFMVANAGDLKLKLQALNNLLVRTPLNQHSELHFDAIFESVSSRTYVDGSEEVYFTVKNLSWPSKIPEAFINAYLEVLQGRPFTNSYIFKTERWWTPGQLTSVSAKSAATFSTIRLVLPDLDMLCNTKLNDFFQQAESQVKPFALMQLPTELRLEIFDYLFPAQTPLRIFSKIQDDPENRPPVRLDIMRVSKALHKETVDHFLNNSSLFIEAYPDLRRGIWVQAYFTEATVIEYVARVMRMSYEARSKITRLEIRIIPEDAASPINSYHPARLDTSSLRRICTELPSLKSVLISFERMPERMCLLGGRARWPNEASFYNGQMLTLAWIHAQLPGEGPRIVWDLTHFRHSVDEPALLRKEIFSQPMMRKLLERDGALELEQSANATRDDLRRWSAIKNAVVEAVARL